MHVALSLAQSLALVLAGAPADPRAISPEANQPALDPPASWPADKEPVPAAESVEQVPTPVPPPVNEATSFQPPKPFVPRPQRECWTTKSQCRQLSITGIVLGSLGLASVATGIGLVVVPAKPIEDEPAYELSTRPPGVVAIGMGVGVLITGVLMIVAGQRGWKLGLDRALQTGNREANR